MWSNWKSDDALHKHSQNDDFEEQTIIIDKNNIYKSHGHIVMNKVSLTRLFMSSTLGILFANIYSLLT